MPAQTWAILIFMAAAVPAPVQATEPVGIAVMEFSSKGGVTQDQMDALSDLLSNQIRSMGDFKVIGKSDIKAMLTLEDQKARLGSCDDQGCLAEIGGALGVRWVVAGNVSLFGKTYLLNLKLIDVEQVSVAAGVSRTIEGAQDRLLGEMPSAVKDLIEKVGDRFTRKKVAPAPAEAATKPVDDGSKNALQPAAGSGPAAGGTVEAGAVATEKKRWSLWVTGSFFAWLGGNTFSYGGSNDHKDYIGPIMEGSSLGGRGRISLGLALTHWLMLFAQAGSRATQGASSQGDHNAWTIDLAAGLLASFPLESRWQPFLSAAIGVGSLRDTGAYNLWAVGPSLEIGVGVNYEINDSWFVGVAAEGLVTFVDFVDKGNSTESYGNPDNGTLGGGLSVSLLAGWKF